MARMFGSVLMSIHGTTEIMARPAQGNHSRHAREAAELLGLMIRNARIERRVTVADVAERAGISRGLVHRIEKGKTGSSIGAVFEVAAIVGLRLFEPETTTLSHHLSIERVRLALLPKSVRTGTMKVKDDF